MHVIKIDSKEITCNSGDNLYKVLIANNIDMYAPCGGMGTCGKCYVWIENDNIGKVKACQYIVTGDISVKRDIPKGDIETKGYLRNVKIDNKGTYIATDIGTTTIVSYLINDGKIIDFESQLNSQKSFGDDVISRINYTIQNTDGTSKLHNVIKKQADKIQNDLCKRNNLDAQNNAIVANTVMLHLFADISPASIGVSPFTPVFTDFKHINGYTLLPSISGYVGADMVAAILASGMHKSKDIKLLIDIGTNGEIALGNRDGILTCATAAGPAFEGAQISCGVGGVSGAINTISINDKNIKYTTIDNEAPIGICGSAIIDVVAEMLKEGIIDETGYMEEDKFVITSDISINGQDIRQIQLAKAAIAAGVQTLLKEGNIDINDVDICYLAGGFGSKINRKTASAIGLIPKELENKVFALGNAAGMGAVLWQISNQCKQELDGIIHDIKYFELSNSATFNNEFMNQMYFE